MGLRVLVLGAGFGGLELTSMLSEALGERVDVTLIDKSDAFIFGFSKLDLMFERKTRDEIRVEYKNIVKPAVTFRQEAITSIDPVARSVVTDRGAYGADVLVVALGADYEPGATPGLAEGGNEFYSVDGAAKLREVIPAFTSGRAIVGVTSTPFKCPPAPSEAALLLHDYLSERGLRDKCEISLVMPFGVPIPPSPDTSRALLEAFSKRGIDFVGQRLIRALDPSRRVAVLDDGSEMPYDLFLGVPKHRVPDVVAASGLIEDDGWIAVSRSDLSTKWPGVYAVGDVTSVGTPKAGVFAEGAARVVAKSLIAQVESGQAPSAFNGAGACYVEFGEGEVGRVDVDFFSGPSPTGAFVQPSEAMVADKSNFGSSRRKRWFGLAN